MNWRGAARCGAIVSLVLPAGSFLSQSASWATSSSSSSTGRTDEAYTRIIRQNLEDSRITTELIAGLPMSGSAPLPYKRTADTPNLGSQDSSDDNRGGMGVEGVVELERFVRQGGTLVTEGSTAAVLSAYGITPGVTVHEPAQQRVRGSVLRGVFTDKRSPIVYGYDKADLPVYFNQTPVLTVNTQAGRGNGVRPRVVMQFPANAGDILLSGSLANGQQLTNHALVVDESLGSGHIVMFALRPFWRWQTQGAYSLVFNAILHWNDLDAGQ